MCGNRLFYLVRKSVIAGLLGQTVKNHTAEGYSVYVMRLDLSKIKFVGDTFGQKPDRKNN
jgi:hypothetical protein